MLDLQTVGFTIFPDFVVFTDTLTIPPDPTPALGIFNTGFVNTLSGSDLIKSRLDGIVDTTDPVEIASFQNSGEVQMGFGWDRISARAKFTGIDGSDFLVVAIDNTEGLIDTGRWADRVEGSAEARGGPGAEATANGILGGEIVTGSGRDTVIGKALAESELDPDALGLEGVDIDTGGGDDRVIGIATSIGGTADAGGAADGIRLGPNNVIDVGAGDDLIKGHAKAVLGLDGANFADGLDGGTYLTGKGDDTVIGKAIILNPEGGGNYAGTEGIGGAIIETGDGRDTVVGKAIARAGDDDEINEIGSGLDGIENSDIDTGEGNDSVVGWADSRAGDNVDRTLTAGIERSDILTGDGHDDVLGKAIVRGGRDSLLGDSGGIDRGTIDTGDGWDTVIGKVSVRGGPGSDLSASGGIDLVTISTGAGHDLVKGVSSLSGSDLLAAYGDGLSGVGGDDGLATVDTGSGNDKVIGIGAKIAIADPDDDTPDGEETSEGIDTYRILLGEGHDFVYARGASAGVKEVDIEGGAGWDVFNLHSGTGMVDGGEDRDKLILSGHSGDFAFNETGFQEGTIQGGVTDLEVADIELFRFDDGLFTFAELF